MGTLAALNGCPPWLLLLAGFGLGAMTKQSLRRALSLARGRSPEKEKG